MAFDTRVSYQVFGFKLNNSQRKALDFHLENIQTIAPYGSSVQLEIFYDDYKFKNKILIKSKSGNFYADGEGLRFKDSLKGLESSIYSCLKQWREGIWVLENQQRGVEFEIRSK